MESRVSTIYAIAFCVLVLALFGCIQTPQGQAISGASIPVYGSYADSAFSTASQYSAKNLFDGSTSASWTSKETAADSSTAFIASQPNGEVWLVAVDLGGVYSVNGVEVFSASQSHSSSEFKDAAQKTFFPKNAIFQFWGTNYNSNGQGQLINYDPQISPSNCSQSNLNPNPGASISCSLSTPTLARFVYLFYTQKPCKFDGQCKVEIGEIKVYVNNPTTATIGASPASIYVTPGSSTAKVVWTSNAGTILSRVDYAVGDALAQKNNPLASTLVESGSPQSHTVPVYSLSPNTTYTFSVTNCITPTGCTFVPTWVVSQSNRRTTFTTNAALNAPSVVANSFSTFVKVRAIPDASASNAKVTKYNFYRATSSTTAYTLVGTVSTADSDGNFSYYGQSPSTTAGTLYYYKAKAANEIDEESAFSSEKYSAILPAISIDSAYKATALNSSQVKIDWTPASPPSGWALANYWVFRWNSTVPSGSPVQTFSASSNTYTDSGLSGTSFSYAVVADYKQNSLDVNSSLPGNVGTGWYVSPNLGSPFSLSAPSLRAIPGDQIITLSWNTPSGISPQHVQIWRAVEDVPLSLYKTLDANTASKDPQSFVDSGLINEIQYSYAIIDENAGVQSPQSNTVTVTPSVNPIIFPAPRQVSSQPGDKNLSISWQEPDFSGSSFNATDLTGYQVFARASDQSDFSQQGSDLPSTQLNYTIANLQNDSTYYFFVRALYGSNYADSDVNNGIPSPPSAYSCNTASYAIFGGANRIPISVTNTGTSTWIPTLSKVYKFAVITSLSNDTNYIDLNSNIATGSAFAFPYTLQAPVTSQDLNVDINYHLEKFNGATGTSLGKTCTIIVTVRTPYAVPQNLSATSGNKTVSLFWQAPDASKMRTTTDLNAYIVYKSNNANFTSPLSLATVSDTSFDVNGLNNDVNYFFAVKAKYDDSNLSFYSNIVNVAPSIDAGNQPAFACVSETIGESYAPNTAVNAKVSVRNTGNPGWTKAEDYKLKVSGAYNTSKDLNADANIQKGQTIEYAFSFTTSSLAGNYEVNWQMFKGSTPLGNACGQTFSIQDSANTQNRCNNNSECLNDTDYCSESAPRSCTPRVCQTSQYTVQNHTCVKLCDDSKYCGETCQAGIGVCVNNNWNENWSSSTVQEIVQLESLLQQRDDPTAADLLAQAKQSLQDGKLNAAQTTAQQGIDQWNANKPFLPFDPLIVVVVVIVGILAVGAFYYFKKKGKGNAENLEQEILSKSPSEFSRSDAQADSEIAKIKETLKDTLDDESQDFR